jgi:hypothetical protein
MMDEVFKIAPARRRAMAFNAVAYALAAGLSVWLGFRGGSWLWLVLAGFAAGLCLNVVVALWRRRYVAKVDAKGVTVCLNTGREMHAGWGEIEAHTIDPARRIGTLMVRAGKGGRVRILPVSSRMMGPEATERFLALIKERLPKIEYRVPRLGAGPGPAQVGKMGVKTDAKAGRAANKNSGMKG